MKIAIYTTHDGRKFYSSRYSMEEVERLCKNLGGLHQVDLVEMTVDEYLAIPATSAASMAFK